MCGKTFRIAQAADIEVLKLKGARHGMAIIELLSAAQNGRFFASAGKAAGLSESDAREAMSSVAPAIAEKLRSKAAADPDAFDQLLDLLEEGGDGLDDAEATTGAEALEDGAAILKDLYGSIDAAQAELGKIAPHVTGAALEKISAISATSVLAGLAASNANTLVSGTSEADSTGSPLAGGTAGGGILSVIMAALVKGLMSGAMKSMGIRQRRAPRRRYYYGYGTQRPRRKRRKTRPPLERIFRDVLGAKR